MTFAIFTPKYSYENINGAILNIKIKKDFYFYENLKELPELYNRYCHKYDAILTSGPIGFYTIKNNTNIKTPLYHLDIQKYEFYQFILDLSLENRDIDFSRIYIDFINKDNSLFNEFLEKKNKYPQLIEADYGDINFYNTMKEKYIELKNNDKIDLAITRISNLKIFFKESNIPYIFLFPSKNSIIGTFNYIIKEIKILENEKKKIIIGRIKTDSDIEKLKNYLEYKFKDMTIKSDKNIIEVSTFKDNFLNYLNENINTILHKNYTINSIGWGAGNSINEARYYSHISEKKYIKSYKKNVYLVEKESVNILENMFDKNTDNKSTLYKILSSLNISYSHANKLVSLYNNDNNIKLTPSELAIYLNISKRTTMRILNKLEDSKYAVSNFKKTERGRPVKVYKFEF